VGAFCRGEPLRQRFAVRLGEAATVPAVVLDRVSKTYDGGVRAVQELSLEVAAGELLVLLGPSGCGKTTILRLVAGLEEATSGDLWLDGQLVNNVPPQHRNIAMVFQHGALYPHLTVRENLAFPLETAGETDRAVIDRRVDEVARALDIDTELDRKPALLSGGEGQRVAMGRALIRGRPAVLLMDEPLASLDVGLRNGLRAEIAALIRSMGLTTIYVTHDQSEALSMADRVVVLRDGMVEDIGTPGRVYSEPATAFVGGFMGAPPINLVWATIWLDNGKQVTVDFGTQRLTLPWAEPRAGVLTMFHGRPVIVGIRPEALSPAANSAGRNRLHGRITGLEYYGHEWLARLDAGLRPADLDEVRRRAMLGGEPDPHYLGEHRGSSLLVRLDAPGAWAAGQEAGVDVDLSRLQIFDAQGRRIEAASSWAAAPVTGR
jgi:multiple sugar transport system ATP-binding protein